MALNITLSKLVGATGGRPLAEDDRRSSLSIHGISIDSRTTQPGDVFVALKGDNFDGHDFIEQAQARGAVALIVSQTVNTTLPVIQVDDTRLALGLWAAAHRKAFDCPIIAVTGSCGKTTVKQMLGTILGEQASVLVPQKSFNNDIGVPLTLLALGSQHAYAVLEMGANHPGEIAYLSRLAHPTVAVITTIAPVHLEGFGSLDGVVQAKAEIFQGLSVKGTAVLNADDVHFPTLKALAKQYAARVISFGIAQDAEVRAEAIELSLTGVCFTLCYQQQRVNIELSLVGLHNVVNALAAASAAIAVGISLEVIKKGLEQTRPVKGRLNIYQGFSNAVVIDDTYNANPLAVRAAIDILAQYTGQRVLVIGDMRELGENAELFHQEIGEYANKQGIDALYGYGPLSIHTVEKFGGAGGHFPTYAALVAALKPKLGTDTTVLVKGSRGMQMEEVVRDLVPEYS